MYVVKYKECRSRYEWFSVPNLGPNRHCTEASQFFSGVNIAPVTPPVACNFRAKIQQNEKENKSLANQQNCSI